MTKVIKCLFLCLGFVLLTGSAYVNAEAAEDIESFDYKGGTYEIIKEPTGNEPGELKIVSCDNAATELIIPETIKHKGKKYIVTVVEFTDYGTKYDFISLVRLSIPSTVREINAERWEFRSGLKEIIFNCPFSALDNFNRMFLYSNGMSAIIYAPTQYLSEYADKFSKCAFTCIYEGDDRFGRSYDGLPVYPIGEKNVMPNRFNYNDFFFEITSLEDRTVSLFGEYHISFSEKLATTGIYDIPGTVYYADTAFTLTKIDSYALSDTSGAIRIPDSVTTISNRCIGEDVVALYMSDNITELPGDLFCLGENESSLTYIKLPAKLKSIPKKVFYECYKLRGIVIPASVEKIGTSAFRKYVRTIYIEGEVPANIEKAVYKMTKTVFNVKKDYVKDITAALSEKAASGKAVIKECRFRKIGGLSINIDNIVLSKNTLPKIKLKVTPTTKNGDYKIAWGKINTGQSGSITQAGNYVPGEIYSVYSYSGLYAFDILSGEFAFCDLER